MINPKLRLELDEEINKHDAVIRDFIMGEYFRHNFDLIARVNKLNALEAETLELEVILILLQISNYESVDVAINTELTKLNPVIRNQVIVDIKEFIMSKSGITNKKLEINEGDKESSLDLRAQIVSNMTNKSIDEMLARGKVLGPINNTEPQITEMPAPEDNLLIKNVEETGTDPYLNSIDPVDKVIKKG